MIPFFRKIRKKMADDNRPIQYMRYAIGEIVLVVIGILIALQINNWNEARKDKIIEQKVLKTLRSDFISNKTQLQDNIDETEKMVSDISQLFAFFRMTQSELSLIPKIVLELDLEVMPRLIRRMVL